MVIFFPKKGKYDRNFILFYFAKTKGANQKQILKMENQNCLHFQRDHIRNIMGECLLHIEQMDKSIAKRNTQRRKNIYIAGHWHDMGTKIQYFALLFLHVDVFHGWINLKGCQSLERFQALGRKQLSHANLANVVTRRQSNTTIVSHDLTTYERWTILERSQPKLRPNRRYMKGPYCWAMHANVWCRDLASCNKLPSTDDDHDPRGKEQHLFEKKKNTTNKQCNKIIKHASSNGFFISRIFHYAKEETPPHK